MSLYVLLKFLHIVLAIVAVGSNMTYGIWLARAARDPQHLGHVLRGIKFLDDRVANPAYGLLLVTGIATVVVGNLSFSTFWIAASLALYVAAIVLGLLVYTPTLRQQIAALEAGRLDSPEYRRLAGRGRTLGIVLGVLVLAIVLLMVAKPTL